MGADGAFISEKELKKHRSAARAGRWIRPVKDLAEKQETPSEKQIFTP